jgi:hypothetical protein
MMDRDEEARREINKGLGMPNRDPDDAGAKARGRRMLNDI